MITSWEDAPTRPIPVATMRELVAMAIGDGPTPEVEVDPDRTPDAPLRTLRGACGRCSRDFRECACDWPDEPTKETETP